MSRSITTRLVRPILLSALLFVAAWALARVPPPTVRASVDAQPVRQGQSVGEGPNRAGLVVRFDDGRIESMCVSFSETEIGGDELLSLSGLADVVFSDQGALCRIDGQGCEPGNCFCQCPNPSECTYWAYYTGDSGAWIYSQLGAMSTIVQNGSLQGWSWGDGDFTQGIPPPETTFEEVCAATSGTENTPTLTPTSTNTPPQGNSSQNPPPEVTFYSTLPSVGPNECTMLNWQTSGATSVTLDGAPVVLSGTQQVCPSADQTWTLQAANGGERVSRQVSIRVTATAASQPTFTPSPQAPVSTPNQPVGGAVMATPVPRPIITQAPQLVATTSQQAFVPTPGAVSPAVEPGGSVPLAPTAEPPPVLTPTPQPTPTRYIFGPLATETPRPRRVLGDGGRPTPTPILLARADSAGSGQAPAAKTGSNAPAGTDKRQQLAPSRAFTPVLLPQYAAYAATMAVLLAMGWYVLRRRQAAAPAIVRRSDNENEPMAGPGRKG